MNHANDNAPDAEDVPATLADVAEVECRQERNSLRWREFEHRLDDLERRLRTMDRALSRLWGNTYGPPILPEPD